MHFLTIWGTSKSRVLMQSNPCTAIKSAASSLFPLPQQLFHLQSSTSISAFQSLAAGVPLLSQHQSTSHSPKLKQLLPLHFYFLSPAVPPVHPWAPGADCSFSGGKELIDHSQFFIPSSQNSVNSVSSLRTCIQGWGAFSSGRSSPDQLLLSLITNHPQIAQTTRFTQLPSATMQQNSPLFGFLPLFYFVSLFLFYFLVPCFSPFHSSVFHWLKPGHGVYNFSFTSRGHLFIGKLSAPVAVVPKNWKIINTRRLNQSFTSKGVSPLILPEALCFKSLIYSSETYCWNIPLIKHPKANGWDWNGAVKLYHTPGALWLTGILTECHRFTGHVTHLFCFVTQLLPGATSVCHTFIATCLASFQNRSGAESTAYGTATQIQIMKDFFPPYLTNIWGPETSPYFKSLHLINVLSRMSAGDFVPVNNNHVALAGK